MHALSRTLLLSLAGTLLMSMLACAAGARRFQDHGIPAPVSESRGTIATADAQGNPMILAMALAPPRNSLLCIDAQTGKTEQFWYPRKEAHTGASYDLLLASTGMFYVMMDDTFLEFDTKGKAWTFGQDTNAGTAMSYAEAPDGTIYAATYPNCFLLAYDPKAKTIEKIGQFDTVEKYPSYMAVDAEGWVYAGIGTAHANLVGFNPKTGERVQFAEESKRTVGAGNVFMGVDGNVYGRAHHTQGWLKLSGGKAEPVEKVPAKKALPGIKWSSTFPTFPDGGRFENFDMPNRTFTFVSAKGEKRQVTFDYESDGAAITSMLAGPGGKIYGSTCHPFRLFSYDPKADKLVNYGGLKAVGGGNWCDLDFVGNTVFGGSYAGGVLYEFDTTKPWADVSGDAANPKNLCQYKASNGRPRVVLALPDKRTVLMSGYPGYGRVGSGIVFYDLESRQATLIENKDLLEGHSTVTLKALPDGTVVGGTSVLAPGGGSAIVKNGRIFLMDPASRKIIFDVEPIQDGGNINCVEVGPRGKVFGITSTARFFVFDPETRKTIHEADLSQYGHVTRDNKTLLLGPKDRLYALLDNHLLRISAKTYTAQVQTKMIEPATTGIGILDGRLYFAVHSHIWSYRLPK